MRCGVTGSPSVRSILFRRAAAGEVGADAGTTGTETECLCMTTGGTYNTCKDMSKKGRDKCDDTRKLPRTERILSSNRQMAI